MKLQDVTLVRTSARPNLVAPVYFDFSSDKEVGAANSKVSESPGVPKWPNVIGQNILGGHNICASRSEMEENARSSLRQVWIESGSVHRTAVSFMRDRPS